ncbi:hypothetical protein, partial [Couchioplanes azureus]|uniref:hypothetical protein n=1 Tax=Couchioplanes caeruleus TaxID=56438 RepID=UPI001E39C2A5
GSLQFRNELTWTIPYHGNRESGGMRKEFPRKSLITSQIGQTLLSFVFRRYTQSMYERSTDDAIEPSPFEHHRGCAG